MASEHTGDLRRDPYAYFAAIAVAVGLVAAGFLVSNLVTFPLVVVFSALGRSLRSTPGYVAITILQNIAFIGVVLAYMRYADVPDLLDIRWPSTVRQGLRSLGWIVFGVVALVFISGIVSSLLKDIGFAPGTNQIVRAVHEDPTLALYLVVLSFLATGPGEEVLFRGGVQGVLRRVFSPIPAIIISSALFGLAHATATIASSGLAGVWGYIVTTFLLGLVLGGLYEWTDSLLIPVVIHGAYNAFTFVQLYVIETMAVGGHLF